MISVYDPRAADSLREHAIYNLAPHPRVLEKVAVICSFPQECPQLAALFARQVL